MATTNITYQTISGCITAYEKNQLTAYNQLLKWISFGHFGQPLFLKTIKRLINRNKNWYERVVDAFKDGSVKAPWYKTELEDQEKFKLIKILLDELRRLEELKQSSKPVVQPFKPVLSTFKPSLLKAFHYLNKIPSAKTPDADTLFTFANYSKILKHRDPDKAADAVTALYLGNLLSTKRAKRNIERVLNKPGSVTYNYTAYLSCLGNTGLLNEQAQAQANFDAVQEDHLYTVTVILEILCDKGRFLKDTNLAQNNLKSILRHPLPEAIANILDMLESNGLLDDTHTTQVIFDKLIAIKEEEAANYAYTIIYMLLEKNYLSHTSTPQRTFDTLLSDPDDEALSNVYKILVFLDYLQLLSSPEQAAYYIDKVIQCRQLQIDFNVIFSNLAFCIVDEDRTIQDGQAEAIVELSLSIMLDYPEQVSSSSLVLAYLYVKELTALPEQTAHNLQLLYKYDHFETLLEIAECLTDSDLFSQNNFDSLFSQGHECLISKKAIPLWNYFTQNGLTQDSFDQLLEKAREQGTKLLEDYNRR